MSKGFISQVERDLTSPSIATLIDILASLGSSLQSFFTDDSPEKSVFTQADMFTKQDDEEKHGKITWLVPDAQKKCDGTDSARASSWRRKPGDSAPRR